MAASGRLQDHIALITGAASGIGQATAVRFAAEGAHVLIADLPAQATGARQTQAQVQALGRRAEVVAIDVTDEAQVKEMVEAAMTTFGRIDVLVAAAGISHDARGALRSSLLELPTAAWQRLLDVNLTGVMLTNRAVAQRMVAGGVRGSIINLASVAARRTRHGMVAYSVSKIGVWMLTRGLALELAPYGIRVNAIGPGLIASPMTYAYFGGEEGVETMGRSAPLGRSGTPQDVANTAVFLASEDSSFYTGSILHPDGGLMSDMMQ